MHDLSLNKLQRRSLSNSSVAAQSSATETRREIHPNAPLMPNSLSTLLLNFIRHSIIFPYFMITSINDNLDRVDHTRHRRNNTALIFDLIC